MSISSRFLSRACLITILMVCTSSGWAQRAAASVALPESPNSHIFDNFGLSTSDRIEDPQGTGTGNSTTATSSDHQAGQTKRILGVIPNFRSVNANTTLPPQSVREKFTTATSDTFDYSAVVVPAVVAAEGQATNATPEFGQGAAGYGRYFWHTFVDQSIENYAVEFIVPAIAHEDTRYYTLGYGGFLKRSEYALTRVVVTKSDTGGRTFNSGEVVGSGAAAGISNLYYPSPERSFDKTAQKWGLNVGLDAATFVFKEFWPDINRTLFHGED